MRGIAAAALLCGAVAEPLVAGGTLKLTWSDCGSQHGKVQSITPSQLNLGQATSIVGKGAIDESVPAGSYEFSVKAGPVSLLDHKGDICKSESINLPLGVGSIAFKGLTCTQASGPVEIDMGITLSSSIPASLARTTIKMTATASNGDNLLCIQLQTAPAEEELPLLRADGKTLINDPQHLENLNRENVANSTWVAGYNHFFAGMTFDEARPLLGTQLSHIADHLDEVLPDSAYDPSIDIPASFDAREKWPGLIHPIRDQQHCGSCWAFSASEVLGDRLAIATGKASSVLSPEDMVSCDGSDMGCQGGRLSSAWSYLKNTGIVSEKCFPYGAGSGQAPSCARTCADGEDWSSSKVKAATAYAINGVSQMQEEIMTKGPIQVAFMVYKSFMSYTSGVYQKHFYEVIPEGGHAVKIIGWGTESNVDYWLVANSWNTNWGMDGYFKIKRGSNACGIEKTGPPYAGTPAVSDLVV